jgi:RNA polymerase sigma factor (sigma-70 family)
MSEAEILKANDALVRHVLRGYRHRPDYQDILQEGRVALLHAFRTHDATRGALSTWAFLLIRWHALRYLKGQREADGVLSLDVQLAEDAAESLIDFVVDDTVHVEDDALDRIELEALLAPIRSERQRTVIQLRLEGLSFREIGRRMGISRQYAFAIHEAALATIREARRRRGEAWRKRRRPPVALVE